MPSLMTSQSASPDLAGVKGLQVYTKNSSSITESTVLPTHDIRHLYAVKLAQWPEVSFVERTT